MTPEQEDALIEIALSQVPKDSSDPWADHVRLAIRAAYAQGREDAAKGAFTLEGAGPDSLDASRYRYLRNVAGQVPSDRDGPMICSGLGDNFDYLRGYECDESVDAAINEHCAAAIRRGE